MKKTLLAAAVAIAMPFAGFAATILDYSPDAIGGPAVVDFSASNIASSQNFVSLFSLSETTTLTGISSYGEDTYADVGTDVIVRVFSDLGGVPSSLLHEISASILVTDFLGDATGTLERRFTALSLVLGMGDYWIGMSGDGLELAQSVNTSVGPGYQMSGTTAQLSGRTVAMTLEGMSAVPLPAGLPLLLSALGLAGVVSRRKKA